MKAIPDCKIILLNPYHLITSNAQVDHWIESCRIADFVLAMPVKNRYRDMKSIGTEVFRRRIGCPIHFIPNLYCDAFFPFFGYARCRDQTVLTTTDYGDSPHGDYHDFLAMAIAASRIPWGRIQRARLAIACKQKATIVKNSEASLRELKHRLDQMNSVMRLDGIPLNCFMGHTFNHPSAAMLNELYSSIWAKILNYSPSSFTPVDGEPFANDGQLPVMDFIVEALQKVASRTFRFQEMQSTAMHMKKFSKNRYDFT
jgi:hypothetical protein